VTLPVSCSLLFCVNQLNTAQRVAVVRCLVEGNSIRSTVRLTGTAKNTVTKLLVDLGGACSRYQSMMLRDLGTRRIQCDEIWSFVGAKEKNVPEAHRAEFGWGDVWTWTALDADSKLMISWYVGMRTPEDGRAFMTDLAARLSGRVQLTTDGLRAYKTIVKEAFGRDIDFAQLVKEYGDDPAWEKRYSPAVCTGAKKTPVIGHPDLDHVSTSYVERCNLTMRMGMRRFTRLTNAFSKKLENHEAAIALHFMYYNFARRHMTLKTTPAVAAGVTDHVWTLEEIVGLLG